MQGEGQVPDGGAAAEEGARRFAAAEGRGGERQAGPAERLQQQDSHAHLITGKIQRSSPGSFDD